MLRWICLGFFLSTVLYAKATSLTMHLARAYRDENKLQPLYIEKHIASYHDARLESSTNEYFDLAGKKIAELNSDYSKSLSMPTYIFRDLRTGYVEGLRWHDGKYIIFLQEKNKPEKTRILEETENTFSSQGWHYYILENFERIQKIHLQMKLVIPGKLDIYNFRIRTLDSASENLKLRVEFDSWFMRLFTPHLDITYSKRDKKILKYYGPSNLLNENGDIQNVYIFYE